MLIAYWTSPLRKLYKKIVNLTGKALPIENNYALDDLAPVVSYETNQVYSSALNWALSIRNIAITGSCGSGKSIFIKPSAANILSRQPLNAENGTKFSSQQNHKNPPTLIGGFYLKSISLC